MISVIVPVYNVEAHVGACLASLRAQSFADFEVIVVDDGSTDASRVRAAEAIAGDPRFRVIEQDNRGLSGARNTGLEHASGGFIAFVDSDDRVAPDYLHALYSALQADGGDWVACAIRFDHPDGGHTEHSAIHGQPDPQTCTPGRYPLTDWRSVIRHFPSAWNKLYRRSLVEGLRFDEGTWFEDHAYFQQAAARTDHILHLPKPLYWQTRGREGQITGQDSDRVFEQMSVLARLEQIMDGRKTHAAPAFEQLATRLLYERRVAIADPDRRVRFAAAAQGFLSQRGLRYAPEWDPAISVAWGRVLEGQLPLSVVIPSDGTVDLVQETVASLIAPDAPELEILVVTDAESPELETYLSDIPQARCMRQKDRGAGLARNAGLAGARGEYVAFVDAGDLLVGHYLTAWVDMMYRHEAQMGAGGYRIGLQTGHLHTGLHGPEEPPKEGVLPITGDMALALHSLPATQMYQCAFLREQGLGFGEHLLPEWPLTIAALLRATPGRAVYLPGPAAEQNEADTARSLWRAPVAVRDLCAALETICTRLGTEDGLPQGWQRRLALRALWERLHCATWPSAWAKWRFALGFAVALRRHGWARGPGRIDPYAGRVVRALAGVRGTG